MSIVRIKGGKVRLATRVWCCGNINAVSFCPANIVV